MIAPFSRFLFVCVRPSAFVAAAALAVSLVACGGADSKAAPAQSPNDSNVRLSEPTSIEEAEARIAAARAELGGDAGGASGTSRFSVSPPAPPPPPPAADSPGEPSPRFPSPQKSAPTTTSPAETGGRSSSTNVEDRCGSPCRALASMRRAVGALCRMTGDEDARCADAKRTLTESEARISPCSCAK
jgi:hypothetical protein